MTLTDLTRYDHALLAQHLFKSREDQIYLPSVLEGLVENLENEDAKDSTRIAIAHRGDRDIADLYAEKWQKTLESANTGDLLNYFVPNNDDYDLDNDERSKLTRVFSEFGNISYGSIMQEVSKAQHDLDGVEKGLPGYTDQIKENAERVKEKYKPINTILEIFKKDRIEELRAQYTKETHTSALKEVLKDYH